MKEYFEWLEGCQLKTGDFHDGGFPPYPETIKAAGVISTSIVLRTFLDEYKKGKKKYKDSILQGIDFLLRTQIDTKEYPGIPAKYDGGFPPMGDLMLITNEAFIDSTAEAVITLQDFLNIFERGIDEKYENKVKTSINRGINWLKKQPNPSRYYSKLVRELAYHKVDPCHHEFPYDIDRYLEYFNGGLVPFSVENPEPSITNTALCIKLLEPVVEAYPEKIKSISNLKLKIKENLEELLSKELLTEYDRIEGEYNCGWIHPQEFTYPETLSILPGLLYLVEDEEDINKIEEVSKKVKTPNYIYVNRGRAEPSTRATAQYISFNY